MTFFSSAFDMHNTLRLVDEYIFVHLVDGNFIQTIKKLFFILKKNVNLLKIEAKVFIFSINLVLNRKKCFILKRMS